MDPNWNEPQAVEEFAEEFKECSNSGIGTSLGGRYNKHKKLMQEHMALDWAVHIEENGIQMYGIFCGFNGGADVARFVMNRMVYEVFKDRPITKSMSVQEVKDALLKKFHTVDMRYLQTVDDELTERLLLMDNPVGNADRISDLNAKIRKGTTVFVVLRVDRHLYVLNCGTSLGLAVRSDRSIIRLNARVHDNDDPDEYERLEKLNIDPLSVHRPTRALGDYFRRNLYDEKEEFRGAKGNPVISDPDFYHFEIDETWKYLVLLSDGVLQNLKDCGVEDITLEVKERLQVDISVRSTAQGLVDAFGRKHDVAYCRNDFGEHGSNRREEMTVIFVQLWDTNKFFDSLSSSSLTDSLDASLPLLETGPTAPYVDITSLSPEIQAELEELLSY
ncbi:protein phosphatase 2C [Oesophagostomum dentatum]|uniref:Protein phosphatase 2C n=1 Tax=Oesophagostomum dentatum TaxID=61180 RepID=A0A0B1TCJ6_OESDE|nr:protein phosphatase 2C [Oesophagostomum dentatum]